MTVHAPQPPSPHPSFVPFRPSSAHRKPLELPSFYSLMPERAHTRCSPAGPAGSIAEQQGGTAAGSAR